MFEGQVTTSRAGDLTLTLLPTEWERTSTKISLDVEAGRVREIVFSIPFKARPEARDQLLELFTHKWGTPRPALEDRGKKVLIFREGQPRVEVYEDTTHGAWRLEIN
jgi:hypothetical protein